jgi:peroxiredoxin (alkyl hydroperoxide reductase subunit C)
MKKYIIVVLFVLSVTKLWSQDFYPLIDDEPKQVEDRNFRIPLIGETAPSFTAESTNGHIKFPSDFGKSWKILFSHPQDFTPVCTTELIELADLQSQFDGMNVKIVAISTDRLDTHEQWKKAMEGLMYKDNKTVKIEFPIVADEDLSVSKKYGMIHPESNTTRDVRGVYIIDPSNVIRAIYFYPKEVGRNTDELVRMVTALEKTSSEKVLTPANWKAGQDVLIPTFPKAGATQEELATEGIYNLSWFLWYKKAQK